MESPECSGCRERDARIAELEARVLVLEALVRDLMDKLKPPAKRGKDPVPPAPGKTATGRKAGGQPGHPPHLKRFLPLDRVSEVIAFVPQDCPQCQVALPQEAGPTDPPPSRFQVAELPKIVATVTEYQGHFRTCPGCGGVHHAAIPNELRAHSIGPNLAATMAYLVGVHGVSKRGVEEIVETLFEVPVSLGTVAKLEQDLSEALATAYQEVRQAVAAAPVKHLDETGWTEAGKKRWLWVAATVSHVLFAIHPRRNFDALKHLLGPLSGILVSDRWVIYDDWPEDRRQVCWAHVKRNWEKQAERGGKAKELAGQWQTQHHRIFELWHLYRGGTIDRNTLARRMSPLIEAVSEILHAGLRSRDAVLSRFCEKFLDAYPTLWLFVVEDGVEPTNNHAERVQRRAVLWRRKSFGCHSAHGCRFVERILTVVQTLKLQHRPVLEYLKSTLRAHRTGQTTPTLLTAYG